MKCYGCEFYRSGYQYNSCSLTESECFPPQEKCDLVNDDGSINYQNEYFKSQTATERPEEFRNR